MDMKMAMGMAVDLGLTGEEEGEEMMSMTDDQMVSWPVVFIIPQELTVSLNLSP